MGEASRLGGSREPPGPGVRLLSLRLWGSHRPSQNQDVPWPVWTPGFAGGADEVMCGEEQCRIEQSAKMNHGADGRSPERVICKSDASLSAVTGRLAGGC